MSLGSIKKAYEVFREHDFSRSFQVRILNMNNVPDYVYNEIIEKPAGQGGYVYAKTYSIPGRSIGNIQVPYQGFNFNVPGQVAYDSPNPWSVTFKTPGDYLVRNALERWSFATANDETSCGSFNIPCPDTTIDLAVLSPKCEIMRVYRLHGVYPQNVSEISYNIEGIEATEFTAAFHYQYWRIAHPDETGVTDSLETGGSDIDSIYESYESKILAGIGANCPGGVNLPR